MKETKSADGSCKVQTKQGLARLWVHLSHVSLILQLNSVLLHPTLGLELGLSTVFKLPSQR